MMPRPTTAQLSAFLAACAAPETDAAIRDALALIDAARSEYATASQISRMRRLAREAVYVAVSAGTRTEGYDARIRLDRAITYATDPTGAFRRALWPLLERMIETSAACRAEARSVSKPADLSHLSPLERAYHREIAALFAAR